SCFFSLHVTADLLCILSFPTRRSSDLLVHLYLRYQGWCEGEGRTAVATRPMFGRDLKAAVPGVTGHRGTNNRPFYRGIGLRPPSDRKSTRLNSSHLGISYAVFCLKKKN